MAKKMKTEIVGLPRDTAVTLLHFIQACETRAFKGGIHPADFPSVEYEYERLRGEMIQLLKQGYRAHQNLIRIRDILNDVDKRGKGGPTNEELTLGDVGMIYNLTEIDEIEEEFLSSGVYRLKWVDSNHVRLTLVKEEE